MKFENHYLNQVKSKLTRVCLVLLSFSFCMNAYSDEIGPNTCGKRIIVRGEIKHYGHDGSAVTNASDESMYSEEVYGEDFTAAVEDLEAGTYTIEIYMAEQYHAQIGGRIFNIYVGEDLIEENLDIYAEVGTNSEYKFTHELEFTPNDENSELSIRFETITDNGKFNAIRILNNNQELVACTKASELIIHITGSGNPFVRDIFTADPSAHVFENKMYVYPSHDRDDAEHFDMRDYHVFSSSDLATWEDHGVVLSVDDVPWASQYMWAPDCAYKDGTYYFYFPARDMDSEFRIGVATSDSPTGPFTPEPEPMVGSFSVDPAVFIDDDGEAYMYFGGDGHGGQTTPWVAKLDDTMKEFSEAPQALTGIDYWFEACWMNKINDIYYLSYSTGTYHPSYPSSSAIAYATSTDPMGPFTYQGVVNGYVSGWTNHHSIVEYKGQTYFFYHNADLSGGHSKRRSIAAEYLHSNDDGSICQVVQTNIGIGSYDGLEQIEAENFSETGGALKAQCDEGGFLASLGNGDSLVFNNVDFAEGVVSVLNARVASLYAEGTLEIYTTTGDLLGSVQISSTGGLQNWETLNCQIKPLSGLADIYLKYVGTDDNRIHINWFSFSDIVLSTENLKANRTELFFYPNPANEYLNLNLPMSSEDVVVRIYDSLGRLTQVYSPTNGRLDVSHLKAGIYFLSVLDKSNEARYHGKLIIE